MTLLRAWVHVRTARHEVIVAVVHVIVVLDELVRSNIVLGCQPVVLRVRDRNIACAGRRPYLDAQHLLGGDGAVACSGDLAVECAVITVMTPGAQTDPFVPKVLKRIFLTSPSQKRLRPCSAKINSDYKLDCTARLYVP